MKGGFTRKCLAEQRQCVVDGNACKPACRKANELCALLTVNAAVAGPFQKAEHNRYGNAKGRGNEGQQYQRAEHVKTNQILLHLKCLVWVVVRCCDRRKEDIVYKLWLDFIATGVCCQTLNNGGCN